jgi:ArsR family transcriptional regulator, arsenate/arsenite/antimonite-responsive transcriptional repressor
MRERSALVAARVLDNLTGAIYFHILGNMESLDVVISLAALAQESRLALFRLLVKRGPEGFTPSQLTDKLEVPGPTLSFHLKELQRAGLIEARREGRFLFYSPNFSRMNELVGFLTDNCCVLADKDCGPACAVPATEAVQPKRKRA